MVHVVQHGGDQEDELVQRVKHFGAIQGLANRVRVWTTAHSGHTGQWVGAGVVYSAARSGGGEGCLSKKVHGLHNIHGMVPVVVWYLMVERVKGERIAG